MWRSDGVGQSWTPIGDALALADAAFTATCIAVNPVDSQYVYVGTASSEVHTASQHGDQWLTMQNLGTGPVNQLLVDPRGAGASATTMVYAATEQGLFQRRVRASG